MKYLALTLAFLLLAAPALAANGAIWTTMTDCGPQQNSNHYGVGAVLYINGGGFDPNEAFSWTVTGNPGGSSADPNIVVASGNNVTNSTGGFCVRAYVIQPDDRGTYSVDAYDKNDNYRTNGIGFSKTATPHLERTYGWEVEKSVSPETLDLFEGDSADVTYTIDVTKSIESEQHSVSGSVNLTNLEDVGTGLLTVVDCVQYQQAGVWHSISCQTLANGVSLSGNQTIIYNYDVDFDIVGGATAYRNFANVSITNGQLANAQKNATAGFTPLAVPDVAINDVVGVQDTNGMNWATNHSATFNYDASFLCNEDEGSHDNTVQLILDGEVPGDSDDASVQVNCHELEVTKDASTSLTRTWTWTIDKHEASNLTELLLAEGQTYADIDYIVTLDATSQDSEWAVTGNIHVFNPAPIDAFITSVSDLMTPGDIAGSVECGVSFPYTLVAGDTLDCTYDADLPNADTLTNTATATLQNYDDGVESGTTDFTGDASVDFSGATVTEVDANVDVDDTLQGVLGPLNAHDSDKTFEYTHQVIFEVCGLDQLVENTASFITDDTDTTGDDSWEILVDVPCAGQSCTLTQGYWKTHSVLGKAPFDDNWNNLPGGLAEQTIFFGTGKTWYDVFWTPPKGGNPYYQLAHQYQAAKLNVLNGASTTPAVDAALAGAEALFANAAYDTPAEIDALKGKTANAVKAQFSGFASTLGSYNEGSIGPGHCDEDSQSSQEP